MSNDPLWAELHAITDKLYARLEPKRFGQCAICGRAPTMILLWPPVTWSACRPCGVRWNAGKELLDFDEQGFLEACEAAGLLTAEERSEARLEALGSGIRTLATFNEVEPLNQPTKD